MINIEKIFNHKTNPMCSAYRSIEYNWDFIEKIPEFSILETCEQNPKWHSEGNVMNHTKLVCKEAILQVNDMSSMKDSEHSFYNISTMPTSLKGDRKLSPCHQFFKNLRTESRWPKENKVEFTDGLYHRMGRRYCQMRSM